MLSRWTVCLFFVVCHFLVFNFLCSTVWSVTTVSNIQDKIPEGAEQRDPSNGSKSTDELLHNGRLTEEELKELYDAINSPLKATGIDKMTFLGKKEGVRTNVMLLNASTCQSISKRIWENRRNSNEIFEDFSFIFFNRYIKTVVRASWDIILTKYTVHKQATFRRFSLFPLLQLAFPHVTTHPADIAIDWNLQYSRLLTA